MDAANSSLAAQRSYDYLRDGKFGKFPNTPEWKVLSDRHKKQNKPFTHYEGIIEQDTIDEDTIQDGITLDFGPATKKHFKKLWDSPDIDRSKLAEFSKTLVAASEPIYQDARDILIRLAQTTPEVFNENWSYTTGYITNCKEGTLWQIATKSMAPIGPFNNSNCYPNLNQSLNPTRELPVSTSSKNPNSNSSKVPGSSYLAQKEITPPRTVSGSRFR
jgi:hypothetical protein